MNRNRRLEISILLLAPIIGAIGIGAPNNAALSTQSQTVTGKSAAGDAGKPSIAIAQAQPQPSVKSNDESVKIWRDAVALYVDESRDYLESLEETQNLKREARAQALKEKFERKILEVELILSKSNKEVIAEIEKHIAIAGMGSLDDTLLMRMAQLYYERSNFDLSEKMRTYEKQVKAHQAGVRKETPLLPEPDYSKAIAFSQYLIDHYPLSPLADKAYYILGYCLFDIDEGDRAAQLYEKMLRAHPTSELASEIRWRLAEHYYDHNQYLLALNLYRKLASYENPFKLKAFYKWGATYYAQGSYPQAADIFLRLFEQTQNLTELKADEKNTFEEESLEYLGHIKAKGVPIVLEESIEAKVTDALAKAYVRAQDDSAARETYLSFVRKAPLSSRSPRFMDQVVSSYEENDESSKAQGVRFKIVQGLRRGSPWWTKNSGNAIATIEAEDIVENNLLSMVRHSAKIALSSKTAVDLNRAITGYKDFIRDYSYSPLAVYAKYELAELRYHSGRFKEASLGYLEVLNDPSAGELKEDAAYGHVLSAAKATKLTLDEKSDLKPQRLPNGLLAPATAPSENEKSFLIAAQQYVNNIDEGERRQKIIYKAAEIMFQHNQFERTRTILDNSIDESSPNPTAIKSLRLIGETYDLQNNWEKVAETNRRILAMAQVAGNPEGSASITRPGTQALNNALKNERLGQFEEAGREYEKFALAFYRSPDASYALWKSAETYRKAGLITQSNKSADRLVKDYGLSSFVSRAKFLRAQNDESLIEYEKAAERFEKFARDHAKDPMAPEALLNASILRRQMLASSQAAKDYSAYSKYVVSDAVSFELAGYYQAAGDVVRAQEIYKKFAIGKSGLDFQIRSLFEIGRLNPQGAVDACQKIASIAGANKKAISAQSSHLANGCAYLKTRPLKESLLTISFVDKNLEVQIAQYDAKFSQLMRLYAENAKTSNREWVAEALVDAGDLQAHLGTKLAIFVQEQARLRVEGAHTRAIEFYRKALDHSQGNLSFSAAQRALVALRTKNTRNLALNRPEALWPAEGVDARLLSWEPPAESLQKETAEWPDIKAAIDGKQWTQVAEKTADLFEKTKNPTWSAIAAHAYGEVGKLQRAKEILKKGMADGESKHVLASYLLFAAPDAKSANLVANLKEAEDESASISAALSQGFKNRDESKKAILWGRKAIAKDPSFGPSYSILANLFNKLGLVELAQRTLDIGIRNSAGDVSLLLQKGYFLLSQRLPDRAMALADEILDNDPYHPEAIGLKSFSLFSKGKKQDSVAFIDSALKQSAAPGALSNDAFAIKLAAQDEKAAEALLPEIERNAGESARANYLLGIYYHSLKKDAAKARPYLLKAQELGMSFIWLEIALNGTRDNNRLPSGDGLGETFE